MGGSVVLDTHGCLRAGVSPGQATAWFTCSSSRRPLPWTGAATLFRTILHSALMDSFLIRM